MKFDRVLTVHVFYDGNLLGIAELDGVAHIYANGYMYGLEERDEEVYYLSPIAPELLALVMEDWAIWVRYLAASGTPEAADARHPALARDRERHDALELAIGDRVAIDPDNHKRFKAVFWASTSPPDPQALWDGQRVQWRPVRRTGRDAPAAPDEAVPR
ncbi:hypothetical protein IV454_03765 [Massilia antarctica]|uniref:DUF551 domain-containing protein n=2 Tax=Massilia antarctica TaxID=2765360 RepID=A0AA48WGC5_9BURK|nr:hypothetical protein [Massilia antarctica]QPI50710.1 hypothetical protein IV454_03765 [Massilia antarctica]